MVGKPSSMRCPVNSGTFVAIPGVTAPVISCRSSSGSTSAMSASTTIGWVEPPPPPPPRPPPPFRPGPLSSRVGGNFQRARIPFSAASVPLYPLR
eukprot:8503848-Pyramimonas_sp.AAC.1